MWHIYKLYVHDEVYDEPKKGFRLCIFYVLFLSWSFI
jgi:hypothetical protein